MDDPQIGRFWQIDPLADDYTYNCPYAFSEDKVINAIELEDLESKDIKEGVAITIVGAAASSSSGILVEVGEVFGPIGLIFGTSTAAILWAYNNPDQVKNVGIPMGSPFLMGTNSYYPDQSKKSIVEEKVPRTNNGDAPQQGSKNHNDALDNRVEELKKSGAKQIRKNQQQVDKDGNKVGKNRPDIQYNDEDGVHHNEEFDYKSSSSQKHEKTIRKNDPNSVIHTTILEKILKIMH
jgi:hypothetical protein